MPHGELEGLEARLSLVKSATGGSHYTACSRIVKVAILQLSVCKGLNDGI